MLPALHLTQEAYGWLSPEALDGLQRRDRLLARVLPGGRVVLRHVLPRARRRARDRRVHEPRLRAARRRRGASRPSSSELGVRIGGTTEDGAITLRKAECLGGCSWAPVVAVDERYRERVTPDDVAQIVAETRATRRECGMPEWTPRLEANVLLDFEGDLRELAAYEAYGGYAQLRARAGRHGRRRAGRRARAARRCAAAAARASRPGARRASWRPAPSATSSSTPTSRSPGSCKDRELLLRTPHALLEGILIVMNVLRLTRAYIYIRGEYLTEAEVLEAAIAEARAARLRRRGRRRRLRRPRSRCTAAPAPTSAARRRRCSHRSTASAASRARSRRSRPCPGAFERPTLLNNVETIATIPAILRTRRRGVPRARHRAERRHARDVALGPRRCARATTRCP